jgi:hypothetical protein
MLRLAHRILIQRFLPLDREVYDPRQFALVTKLHQECAEEIANGVPIIIADNVSDYVNESFRISGKSTIDLTTYPPCPPAFGRCFIEWNQPEIFYPHGDTIEEQGTKQIGCLLCATTSKESMNTWAKDDPVLKAISATAKWLLVGILYICDLDGRSLPVCVLTILLDEEGRFISGSAASHGYISDKYTTGQFGSCWAQIITTLAFMQCKNVERVDVTKQEGQPRKWCRRQRVPELQYHTLLIDPNIGNKTQSSDRKTEGDRSGKALHICRGHFMHSVNDGVSKGLFGRGIYGTFWVPAHVRGTADLGRVIPTYNVLAPTG